MPWTMRLTSHLRRRMIYEMSPLGAGVVTMYGEPAEPTSLKNLHLRASQTAKRGTHLLNELDRVALKGAFTKRLSRRRVALDDQRLLVRRHAEKPSLS